MDTKKIDWLNVGLIILTLIAAFWMPFALFLFSYAVLGPLHYMTEINWLEERKYFSKSNLTPWLLGACVLFICLGSFFAEGRQNPVLSGYHNTLNASFAAGFFKWLEANLVHIAFISFVLGVALAAFKGWAARLAVVLMGVSLAYAFRNSNNYTVLVGSMLPTIIHVGIFTGIFMLYGALKAASKPGLIAVGAFVAAHLVIIFWPINPSSYFLDQSGDVAHRFNQSGFQGVIYQIGQFIGSFESASTYALNSESGIRLGIFLAFIYTYHYLNWFSKTSVIRWHQVSKRKLAVAIFIWIFSVALYTYDYRVGLLALLFLSLLHVVYEFPLNYISIIGVLEELGEKFGIRKKRAAPSE
ncbi:MAG: hypothetical protein JNJ57_04725 [Saprospiraceae bacterium]|nr:hypothetical protein [Saprospiraceae bacterium]